VIPVPPPTHRKGRHVATVQFSRAVREGDVPADGREGPPAGGRSLKTQQHAPARDRRYADQAGPGPVDVLAARPVTGVPPAQDPKAARVLVGAVAHVPSRRGLPRKEVIQPHLPVRLPCYDFTPVTSPTFDGSLPKGLGHRLRVLLTPVV
jgi:hypothetical protein